MCLVQPCPYALLYFQCPLQGLRQPSHPSSILRLPVLVILTLQELGPVGFLPLSSTRDVAKEGVLTNNCDSRLTV